VYFILATASASLLLPNPQYSSGAFEASYFYANSYPDIYISIKLKPGQSPGPILMHILFDFRPRGMLHRSCQYDYAKFNSESRSSQVMSFKVSDDD